MRINRYIALATGMSRRAADNVVGEGRVLINSQAATAGQEASEADQVTLDGQLLTLPHTQTILLNKPAGYVVSRDGQGSRTIYELLPPELQNLKPVGRLDKDSSGLLLLTNDGELAQQLTHPSFVKEKVYEVELDKPLTASDRRQLEQGIELEDGPSHLRLQAQGADTKWQVTLHEGRNRQIRRTFAALGYTVTKLHRISFGPYQLGKLPAGSYRPAPRAIYSKN